MYLSELVCGTPFPWVYISSYVNNDTAKVPILAEIGVHVQGSTCKIWNLSLSLNSPQYLQEGKGYEYH